MRPRGFGVGLRVLPGFPFDSVAAALDAAARAGATSLQVPSPAWLSSELDRGELRAARAEATARGMRLSTSVGPLNACWPERAESVLRVGGGDLRTGLIRLLDAAAEAGIRTVHTTVGVIEDRMRVDPRWREQLVRNGALLAEAAALAGDRGMTLVLKTHEEMSSVEAREMVRAAGPAARLGFSPVNLLVGMEDPVAAFARVAELVGAVFVDDARLVRIAAGYRRRMESVGRGSIPWEGILGSLADADGDETIEVVLDVHRAQFDVDAFRPRWHADHADLERAEFAATAGRAGRVPDADEDDAATRFAVGAAVLRARQVTKEAA